MRRRITLLVAIASMLAGLASAQNLTGSIEGRVVGPEKAAIPGAMVGVTSPALQGAKHVHSDVDGSFHLPLLPPGVYELKVEADGFRSFVQPGLIVALDRVTHFDAVIEVAASTEVTVLGATPLIDSTSTRLGDNLDIVALTTLPTGRSYASVIQTVAGASTDNADGAGSGLVVYGSSGSENTYLVDGINTTNAEYGLQGKDLNFEFIQEVEVKTGGYEAEYGRATGGVVNVITKSGGNEFKGDVFAYYDDDALQGDRRHDDASNAGALDAFEKKDFGFDIGGYVLPDRLWFFLAYDQVDHERDTPVDYFGVTEIYTSSTDRDLSSAKLTWAPKPNWSVMAAYLADPTDETGAILDAQHGTNGEESTFLGTGERGGRDYSLRGEAFVGDLFIATAQVSRHQEDFSKGPGTAAGEGIQYVDTTIGDFATGGFGFIPDKEFTRDFYGASLSGYFGKHTAKIGLEFQRDQADVRKTFTGGQQVFIFENPVDPSRPIYQHFYWTTPEATVDNAPISALVASPQHRNTTLFLQDKWEVSDRLTISAGIRWDRQEIQDYSGATVIDLDKNLAPRLGLIWRPFAEHGDRAYGSYGLYYEEIPMDLVIRSFSFERQPHIYNFDREDIHPDPEAEAAIGETSNILGQAWSERVDPDLEGQSLEEIILGYDHEAMPGLRIGAKFIYRRYKQVIEDFLCDPASGEYCIGNPGEGLMEVLYDENYSETEYPAPKAQRQYHGYQLDVEKRTEHSRWVASYIYSRLKGNYDGEFAPFTNVGPDPNISAAYDYAEFTVNNRGWLSNDRRHQFKVSGTTQLPWNLSLGVSAYYRTGTPLTRYGFDNGYGRYEHFLTTRGAEGRTPDTYEVDVHLGYPVDVGPVVIHIIADVFNLLDAQRPVLIDQRWDFDGADNESEEPTNPNYGEPLLRQDPRSVRLGLRLSF